MPRRRLTARLIFAENVRNLRRSQGLSQEALADLADIHRTYIGQVESGARNIAVDNMERLASALGKKLHELLTEGRFKPVNHL